MQKSFMIMILTIFIIIMHQKKLIHSGNIDKTTHEVWFTDAATTFNILRFSDEFPTAGTALWRLGSEDQRMWKYYNRNLSNASLQAATF